MPKKAPYDLPPLKISKKNIGENIARIRKGKGLTQLALAEEIGITQTLVSDYETGRSNLNSEMLIRFALALNTSADSLLGLKNENLTSKSTSLKISRRMNKIESLPESEQRALLKTIDIYLRGSE